MTGPDDSLDSRLVRPFSMRRGRTGRRTTVLTMSTLVWTVSSDVAPGELSPEHVQILRFCHDRGQDRAGIAVAELAALLDIPLAMTKVLVGELIDRDLLAFSHPAGVEERDLTMMKRVLDGLRELRV